MTTTTLAEQLRSLPESERLVLAQVLWESLDVNTSAVGPDPVREAIEQARVRHIELDAANKWNKWCRTNGVSSILTIKEQMVSRNKWCRNKWCQFNFDHHGKRTKWCLSSILTITI